MIRRARSRRRRACRGKQRSGGISKQGNRTLRNLLILGVTDALCPPYASNPSKII